MLCCIHKCIGVFGPCDSYVDDVTNMCWSEHPDTALDEFMKLLLPIIEQHAPVKKLTVRTVKASWIDEELKNCMVERDGGGERSG